MAEPQDGPPAALFRFFERLPRQGPGSAALTAAIFERVRPRLPAGPVVADMGCGSGAAGLVLARLLAGESLLDDQGARVHGVDIHPPFLRAFEAAAAEAGLAGRIDTRCASMLETGWPDGCLDLVWSEGAVFTVGFDAALVEFARLLKSGGVTVISEATWFQDPARAPAELRAFWHANYAGMRTVAGNLAAAEAQGWRFLHAERLADAVWESAFYAPMERLIAALRAAGETDLLAIAAESEREIALFRRHSAFYGYVYYALERD